MAHAVSDAKDWRLPLFITRENKYSIGLLMFALATVLYMTPNHFHFLQPQQLPMSWVDLKVPFIPRTVWVYVSEYLFFTVIYVICRDLRNVNKYFYSFLGLQTISVLIFWVWPTTFPRDQFPLPEGEMDALSWYVFSALRVADTPANCCPSLHVSSVYLSAFLFLEEQRGKFPFFFLWGTAIALSTLTTKQHYFIDVVTGFLMAVISYWFFYRLIDYFPAKRFQTEALQANR